MDGFFIEVDGTISYARLAQPFKSFLDDGFLARLAREWDNPDRSHGQGSNIDELVEVIAMCSNPTRGFRRLLISYDPETLSQVRGKMAMRTVLDVPRGQQIPYSPKRHLNPGEIEQIVAGYLAGTTARELGERFEVDRKTVSGILKANGVTMRLHPMQPDEIERAIQLYESGLSLGTAARSGDKFG